MAQKLLKARGTTAISSTATSGPLVEQHPNVFRPKSYWEEQIKGKPKKGEARVAPANGEIVRRLVAVREAVELKDDNAVEVLCFCLRNGINHDRSKFEQTKTDQAYGRQEVLDAIIAIAGKGRIFGELLATSQYKSYEYKNKVCDLYTKIPELIYFLIREDGKRLYDSLASLCGYDERSTFFPIEVTSGV